MGILSTSASITRYIVRGEIKQPILENISQNLEKYKIREIDGKTEQFSIGWTCFDDPYHPNFMLNRSFIIANYLVFSMRLDKKTIPSKLVKKLFLEETQKRLQDTGRDFLTRDEKESITEGIIQRLCVSIPASPNVYDIIWNYEENWLLFFTNVKSANEALESLFHKTFDMRLIRLFPYTLAHKSFPKDNSKIDQLKKLAHN